MRLRAVFINGNQRLSPIAKRPYPTSASLCAKPVVGLVMSFKFAIGDTVTQAFLNHAEGTIIAILKDRAGEHRYVVEMVGHRTIQIASEGSLVAAP